MAALILLLVFIIIDVAALWWGVDSRDEINSPEWERRHRRAFSF